MRTRLKSLLAYLPAPLQKILTWELIKFIFVGGFSALIEFSLLILLVEKAHIDYRIGNVIAFAITNVFTYILTRRYVFTPADNSNRVYEALLFIVCLIGALLVNQVVLWALVEFTTTVNLRVAKVIAIVVTVVWNFFTRKHLVFRDRTAREA